MFPGLANHRFKKAPRDPPAGERHAVRSGRVVERFKLTGPLLCRGSSEFDITCKSKQFDIAHIKRLPSAYSEFGYDPSTLTKLHCSLSKVNARATFRSFM